MDCDRIEEREGTALRCGDGEYGENLSSMLNTVKKFRALPPEQRELAVASFLLLAFWRPVVVWIPLRFWSGRLGDPGGGVAEGGDQRLAEAVGRAVNGVAARVPWRANCLNRALAAASMLRAREVPHTLSLGVRRTNLNMGLEAHAWLQVGGRFVTGEGEQHTFHLLSRYNWTPGRT